MDFDNRKVFGDTSITDGLVVVVVGSSNCVDAVLVLVFRGVGGPKWCCGVVVGPKWCGIEG